MSFRLVFFRVAPFAFFILIAPEVGALTCGTGTCTDTPTLEEFCFVGNGYLDSAPPCTAFQADFSSGFGIRATLSNYGGFSVGDEVHVEGCAESVFSTCMVGGYHISNNTIESTFPEPEVPALRFSGRAAVVILVAGLALWFGKKSR